MTSLLANIVMHITHATIGYDVRFVSLGCRTLGPSAERHPLRWPDYPAQAPEHG